MEFQFKLFGILHLSTVGAIFLIGFILAAIVRNERRKYWIEPIGIIIAALLITNEIFFQIKNYYHNTWDLQWGLPLQPCDLAIFAVAYSLLRRNQFIWEIAYFWGLAGTLQAIATPDILFNSPVINVYSYTKFFVMHGCIIIGVIFLAVGCRRPIYRSSIARVFVATNIYAVFIAAFNQVFQTNYLYLSHKPDVPSLLDYLGPWPYYIAGAEFIFIISLVIYYFPYFIYKRTRKISV